MRIVLTGGGSGGHITPTLAVANELKRLRPGLHITFVGQKGDQLADIPSAHPAIDDVYEVWAGKFRRYHGDGWRQMIDLPTQARNMRDAFRVVAGVWQSYWLLRRLKPAVLFTRGGFVSVPVAIGAWLNGVPYVTHDSDSTPSLANRIIARWAALHAVALPAELYPYSAAKTRMVGIPVEQAIIPVTSELQQKYRHDLGLDQYKRLLFITGGGNGAKQLNDVIVRSAAALLAEFTDLAIVHVAGRRLAAETEQAYDQLGLGPARPRVRVEGFITGLYRYSGAADLIIARGGATALAEFAVQAKACLIIPAKQLAWQGHHAGVLAERGAIICMSEMESERPGQLAKVVSELLRNDSERRRLGTALAQFARPDAAHELAVLLLEQARGNAA